MTEGFGSGIRIQFALNVWVWIRIRSLSDRIRNPEKRAGSSFFLSLFIVRFPHLKATSYIIFIENPNSRADDVV